jgi:hypothetical protein
VRAAGVRRDPVRIAESKVSVSSFGSSGLVSLSVRDTNPAVAVDLANRVAAGVIAAHADVTNGRYTATLGRLTDQITNLQRSIASIDAHIKGIGPLYEVARPNGGVPLSEQPWAQPNELLRQRADLSQSLGALQSEKATVEAQRALAAQGVVVDPAAAPAVRVAGRLVPDAALGGLLGLVIGIALAATLETFRPTLVGRDAIARNLGAPVLAELRAPVPSEGDIAEAAMHIELAAVAAGAHRVGLLSLGPEVEAEQLRAALAGPLTDLQISVIGPRDPGFVSDATGAAPEASRGRHHVPDGATGVVLVAPKVARLAELTRIAEFLTISGWPLLGLIVVPGRPRSLAWRLSPTALAGPALERVTSEHRDHPGGAQSRPPMRARGDAAAEDKRPVRSEQ